MNDIMSLRYNVTSRVMHSCATRPRAFRNESWHYIVHYKICHSLIYTYYWYCCAFAECDDHCTVQCLSPDTCPPGGCLDPGYASITLTGTTQTACARMLNHNKPHSVGRRVTETHLVDNIDVLIELRCRNSGFRLVVTWNTSYFSRWR